MLWGGLLGFQRLVLLLRMGLGVIGLWFRRLGVLGWVGVLLRDGSLCGGCSSSMFCVSYRPCFERYPRIWYFAGLQILGLRGARTYNLWSSKMLANRPCAGFGATPEACERLERPANQLGSDLGLRAARKACKLGSDLWACEFLGSEPLGSDLWACEQLGSGLRATRKRFVSL